VGTKTDSGKQAKVRESIDRLLEVFAGEAEEVLPDVVAKSLIIRQQGDAPCSAWSLGNQVIMLANDTEDARGYKQWQEAGRTVKKGAKSFCILAPNTRKVREKDPETGEEVERVRVTGFRGVPVFRYEDTEGDPVEPPDYAPLTLPPLVDVAASLGVKVDYAPSSVEVLGVYIPKARRIRLYSTSARVFFHELAHAAAIEADGARKPGSIGNADEEVVADTVAAVLCLLYGFEYELPSCRKYIEKHSTEFGASEATGQERIARGVGKVLRRVERTLEFVMRMTPAEPGESP
jgi:hypothetical protein